MENFTIYILPYVNFALFAFLIFHFGRKPVSNMLATRKENFRKDYEEARKLLTEAEAQNELLSRRLTNLDQEIAQINQRATAVTQQEIARVQENAKRMATHFKDEVSRISDAEVNQALSDLKQELMTGVMRQVHQSIATQLDGAGQQKLVQSANKKLINLDGPSPDHLSDGGDADAAHARKKQDHSQQKPTARD